MSIMPNKLSIMKLPRLRQMTIMKWFMIKRWIMNWYKQLR